MMYIEGKLVLYLVDKVTYFQDNQQLKDVLAQYVQDQLYLYLIDRYLRPPNLITTNAGKLFMAMKFKKYAANMGIIVKNTQVEANYSIGMVKRYHRPLQ